MSYETCFEFIAISGKVIMIAENLFRVPSSAGNFDALVAAFCLLKCLALVFLLSRPALLP